MIKVDTKQLDKFVKDLNKIEKDVDKFIEDCTRALTVELLRRTIQKTPTDTGQLRRGWTGGSNQSAESWARTASIKKQGKNYTITVTNNTKYAPYVEYGHRIRGGHGWKSGYFMLTLSEREVEQMKDGLIAKKINQFLKKVFK